MTNNINWAEVIRNNMDAIKDKAIEVIELAIHHDTHAWEIILLSNGELYSHKYLPGRPIISESVLHGTGIIVFKVCFKNSNLFDYSNDFILDYIRNYGTDDSETVADEIAKEIEQTGKDIIDIIIDRRMIYILSDMDELAIEFAISCSEVQLDEHLHYLIDFYEGLHNHNENR